VTNNQTLIFSGSLSSQCDALIKIPLFPYSQSNQGIRERLGWVIRWLLREPEKIRAWYFLLLFDITENQNII
jgi:hypothetical protein